MTSSSVSPIEYLNAAIESYNPFNRPAAVKQQDVWGKGFPDIETLNAHASDAVFQAIKQVSSSPSKVTSIAITADLGVGKTHLISRIRHRLKDKGGAFFVYASASKFGELNRIQYQFLQTLGASLSEVGSEGVKQWQELAAAMLNQIAEQPLPLKEVIENFPSVLEEYGMDHLTQEVCQNKPHISDPDVVRAILWTLSKVYAPYAIKWLSGNDISEAKAAELELPNVDKEDREANAFDTVLQILSLISDYKALIVCFDELEGVNFNEGGYTKAQVVAELVKNLFDSLNLDSDSRGVVLLTVMIPDTWQLKIKILPGGMPYRVSAATREPIELKHMDGDSIVELVTLWLREFYESRNLVPHNPVYPFKENKLRELAREKPTVRKVLQWCAGHFEVTGTSTIINSDDSKNQQPHPVEAAFNKELAYIEGSIQTLLENKAKLANALRLGFSTLVGQTIEKVKIAAIEEVKAKASDKGYIDFKIIGKENNKTVKIGVAVLQQSNARSVLAGLNRLIEYNKFDLTRGCLVRSKEISDKTQAQQCLSKLLSPNLGGEWVLLKVEAIKPLLAILFVYEAREDYEVSEEQIFDFIAQNNLAGENYLIQEIMSDPSGQIPVGLVDEDSAA
ncbi:MULTISPECIES: ATP-binding protein [Cyanophyceae]|uniref:ATP-binding protein n=1 Tax=Cyanophyceae TaxID=3028117 RepID=UPI001682768D|nr:ATP-binding protein [Trichocoleus sp. FACHB-40]MBD2006164.1 ATP-binding protein [Trichocoleus sp. FACHB-40]